ncbi:MAG: hypothetical protein DMD52_05050 [Gemmatimonadetes bacterium]|nr:MAG: hypothetical protein DMD52_05050 [Gemmatimonadota bacterium]
MAFASGTIVYAVLRTILAVAIGLAAVLGGRRAWPLVGQAVSDVACLACTIAYVDADLRSSLGWLAVPFVLYVIGWEGRGALRVAASGSDSAADGVGAELLEWLGGLWRPLYRILLVLPPVGAGMFLVLGLLYPGGWVFPGTPAAAPLRCLPETVARGDTVMLRMSSSHGGELGVFTPAHGFLYIVDFAPQTAPPSAHFEYRQRFTLPSATATGRVMQAAPAGYPEVPVFTDTGTYQFRVSDAAELSASLMCRVHYVGERDVKGDAHVLPHDH